MKSAHLRRPSLYGQLALRQTRTQARTQAHSGRHTHTELLLLFLFLYHGIVAVSSPPYPFSMLFNLNFGPGEFVDLGAAFWEQSLSISLPAEREMAK